MATAESSELILRSDFSLEKGTEKGTITGDDIFSILPESRFFLRFRCPEANKVSPKNARTGKKDSASLINEGEEEDADEEDREHEGSLTSLLFREDANAAT